MNEPVTKALPKVGLTLPEINSVLSKIEMTEPYAHFARVFRGPEDVNKLAHEIFHRFAADNGFFSLYLPYMQSIEQSVINMGLSLLHREENSAGNFTSGGSESNFSAVHAARGWARVNKPGISRPNVVAPRTIHPSIPKAGQYLNVEIITTDVTSDGRAIPEKMAAAINENTIMLAASAPCWGFSVIDPIEQIGALAERNHLWMHVDGCVGTFISPFLEKLGHKLPLWDFRVPGVMSISGDLHKFAYCLKPASTIYWRHQEFQKFHEVTIDDRYLGVYKTACFAGSRPAGSIFAAWAVMSYLGEEGYLRLTKRVLESKRRIVEEMRNMEGLQVWEGDVMPMHFHSTVVDTSAIYHAMGERGWFLFGRHTPEAITVPIDPAFTDEMIDRFLTDLRQVNNEVIAKGAAAKKTSMRYV